MSLTWPNLSSEEISCMHQMDTHYILDFEILEDNVIRCCKLLASYSVNRLLTSSKVFIPFIEKHVNPNDIDYNPFWDKKRRIRFNTPFHDSCFNIDFFNATSAEGEPLIGSARLPLRDLVLGDPAVKKKLVLTSPSGSPIGEVTLMVAVRRVENPLPPEKTVTVVYEEARAVDDFDENDLT